MEYVKTLNEGFEKYLEKYAINLDIDKPIKKNLMEDAHGYDYKDCYICDKDGCWEVTRKGNTVGKFSTDREAEEFIDNKQECLKEDLDEYEDRVVLFKYDNDGMLKDMLDN